MLNIEKYKEEILEKAKELSIGCAAAELAGFSWPNRKCKECRKMTMEWLLEEYKEPILTDEEKVIIKNIIKAFEPFGKKLSYIAKKECYSSTRKHYLVFRYKNDSLCTLDFNNDELFEGMESDVDYTPEELGLC